MACLHHLSPKTAPWHQGARLCGMIRRARRPRAKREAAKKFPGRKRMLPRSQRDRDKTVCRLQWRCAGIKGRLRISKGPRWP